VLSWDAKLHGLGVAEMDATHEEFAQLATEVARAGDEDFALLFGMLVEHTRRHFDNESRLMRDCRFFATAEHEGEHRRVLGELAQMQRGIDEGRLAMARTYARRGLPDWFRNHVATMDAALAAILRRAATPPPGARSPHAPSDRAP
jgi:hemerythrin-like metal-binding protein